MSGHPSALKNTKRCALLITWRLALMIFFGFGLVWGEDFRWGSARDPCPWAVLCSWAGNSIGRDRFNQICDFVWIWAGCYSFSLFCLNFRNFDFLFFFSFSFWQITFCSLCQNKLSILRATTDWGVCVQGLWSHGLMVMFIISSLLKRII